MKKSFALFLCIFYFLVSNGITINKHYCGGRLVSVKVGIIKTHQCACGTAMKKNCCHNQSLQLKNNSHQNLTKAFNYDFSIKSSWSLIQTCQNSNCASLKGNLISSARFGCNTPLIMGPVFLRKRVLLI
ncbi:MAG: HYC_CC_PP family protein [Bacteroidota bacterium]